MKPFRNENTQKKHEVTLAWQARDKEKRKAELHRYVPLCDIRTAGRCRENAKGKLNYLLQEAGWLINTLVQLRLDAIAGNLEQTNANMHKAMQHIDDIGISLWEAKLLYSRADEIMKGRQ